MDNKYGRDILKYINSMDGFGREERYELLKFVSKEGPVTIEEINKSIEGRETVMAVQLGIAYGIFSMEPTQTTKSLSGRERSVYNKIKLSLSDKVKLSTHHMLYLQEADLPPAELVFIKESYGNRIERFI